MKEQDTKYLTIRKQELKFREGGSDQFQPAGDYKSALQQYLNDPSDDPIDVQSVSIVVVTQESKKFFECQLMHDNIVVPDAQCMFYIRIVYPWHIKSGARDADEILTDGERFYLVTRNLAKTPFKLNDYSRDKLNAAITKFVETI